MMNRQLTSILLAALLLSGCASGRMCNPAAIGVGASIGGNIGGAVGGIIGESEGGWRGGYRGSAIGTIVGTVAGAAIGHVMTAPKEDRIEERGYTPEVVERYPSAQHAVSHLKLRKLRFIDDNRNHVIDAGENCKIIFEVMNEGDRPVYNIVPVVETVGKVRYIGISSTVMIEEILPGEGIKYTATVYAGKKLKDGEVLFRVAVAQEDGKIYDIQEFSLPTRGR
ncbi:hypothetical protein JCM6292_3495 [Bacteroides pyogenes JCM 6292]|uniref:Glycine zipper domain-containing protein n=3 Tax=Bacteroides pyogenes TaxID=310300 RepID=W4PGN8_9BACE|nr:hypothetical protein JCM6292_3495 [Bacteroides pyogenes JCM 6292]GAE18922.1 hypothetical protein JCM6294_1889 [Bacteroides pyogenes DSM 20611 = JCM 6294]